MATDRTNIMVGRANLSIDAVDVGFTQGGVGIRMAKEFFDVEGDQNAGVIKKEITMERMFVSTTLLEQTLENVRQAMNEPSGNATSGTRMDFGSATPTANEHQLIITGPTGKAPNSTTRTYTLYRCVAIAEIELRHMRDGATVIEVEFECLKDENQGNKFGYFVDA